MPESRDSSKASIFNIQPFSTTDGPGLRTVVFFQGCNLECLWCHNPESWQMHPPPVFLGAKCIMCGHCDSVCAVLAHKPPNFADCTRCGACADVCAARALTRPCTTYGIDELFDLLAPDFAYIQNGGGGITFSGGEPMLQADFLARIIRRLKAAGLHTAVDTAGNVPFDALCSVDCDLFLYDIKATPGDLHRRLTGADGRPVWDNLARLVAAGRDVHVRVPCVPGANWDNLADIGAALARSGIRRIEPLAYHSWGCAKADAVGTAHTRFAEPTDAQMREAKKLLGV